MKRKNHVFHFSVWLFCLVATLVSTPSGFGVEAVDVTISPDNFTNTLVVAGESLTQTMVISNGGNTDLKFSFCPLSSSEISAAKDTFITEHDGYGGETSTHGTNTLRLVHAIAGLHRTHPVVSFDLTPYAGKTVKGATVDFLIYIRSGWGENHVSQSVSVRESLADWDEMSASYANFGGVGFNAAIHTGPNLTTQTVIYNGETEPITFKIPSSVVQRWIDDPSSNKGLFLISNTTATCRDMSFWSRETGPAPQLSFELDDGEDDDGLIAHYPFNGNADDESGNGHNGVEMGSITYTGGVDGMSAVFNGTDAKIKVPHSEDLNLSGSLSISCWLKSSGTNPYSGIIAKMQNNTPRNGYLLYANSGYPADFQVILNKEWPETMGSAVLTEGFFDGDWHHIVTTYDGETLALYKDGQIEMEVAYTNGLTPNSLPLYIGWDPYYITSQQRYFNGQIDDVRIYSRALSNTEIQELYGATDDDGLVAHYPFNGNANDESGNGHDGTVNGATLTADRFGNADSAYLFDGINDRIELADEAAFDFEHTDAFSQSFWIKTSDATAGNKSLYAKMLKYYPTTGYNVLLIDGKLRVYLINAHPSNEIAVDGTTLLNDDQWHHVVVSYDGTSSVEGMAIYIDGVEEVSDVRVNALSGSTLNDVVPTIGSRADQYSFNGLIDDVHIYSRALSEAEIQELYSTTTECALPDWLSAEPMFGTIPAGASVEVAVALNASNMVAGGYVEYVLDIFGNGSGSPIGSVPVSMWVVPSAPVMVGEPAYTEWKSNEVFWSAVGGPVEYWVEALALEHCSPGGYNADSGKSIPKGWSNVKRFHDPNRWMQESGWITPINYLFTGLRLNTKYQYRVKASVTTDIGRLESTWSDWVESCQVPVIRELDESKVPATWKQEHFGASENFCGLMDSDGDGLCDFDEYVAGALPFDAQSSFEVNECSTCADGHFILNWDSVPDRIYSVYWSESIGEVFLLLIDGICYPQNSYTDSVHNAESGGFYRIEVRLPE